MNLHRFIKKVDFNKDKIRLKDEDFSNQVRKVLRLKPGDKLILVNGKGQEAVCKITNFKTNVVDLRVLERKNLSSKVDREVYLFCSILKKKNFELVAQKAVEVGVSQLFPVISKRTVKLGLRFERLRKIMKEASEQSGRVELPKLNEIVKFEEAVKRGSDLDINLFFDERGEDFKLILQQHRKVGVWIGPEGGWNNDEIEVAKSKDNFKFANLGNLTLRAETAAIVASFLAINL